MGHEQKEGDDVDCLPLQRSVFRATHRHVTRSTLEPRNRSVGLLDGILFLVTSWTCPVQETILEKKFDHAVLSPKSIEGQPQRKHKDLSENQNINQLTQ
mgnify:CR=1 FL=1